MIFVVFGFSAGNRAQTEKTKVTPLPTKEGFVKIYPGFYAKTGYKLKINIVPPLPNKEAFEKIIPGFEAKTGYKVKMTIGTGVGTKEQAAKGEPFDVFVILPPYQAALDSGNMVRETKTTIARFVMAMTI